MELTIRQAMPRDIESVSDILREAARWLEERGMAQWRQGELLPEQIAADIHRGLFVIARCDGEDAGTIRFQLEDKEFWPDVPQHDSAFVHKAGIPIVEHLCNLAALPDRGFMFYAVPVKFKGVDNFPVRAFAIL